MIIFYNRQGGTQDATDKPGDLLLVDLFLASLVEDCQEIEMIWDGDHIPLELAIAYDSLVFHVCDPQNLEWE